MKLSHVMMILYAYIGFALLAYPANGQTAQAKYVVSADADAKCELNNRHIDSLVQSLKENNERIFIISRRNIKENRNADIARLKDALSVLTIKKISEERIVTGVGEPISDSKGRLEFYRGSELFLISYAEKNSHVCLTCCP